MKKTLLMALVLAPLCVACSDDTTTAPDGAPLEAGSDLQNREAGADLAHEAGADVGADGPAADALSPDAPAPDLYISDGPLPPSHSWCASPKALPLSGGTGSASGTTAGAADQFPTVNCGNPNGPWAGPQLFYKVALAANTAYRAQLTPGSGFDAALYAFPASAGCTAAAVDSACAAFNSDVIASGAAGVEKLTIKPAKAGDWILAVDSHSKTAAGTFSLVVGEHTPPANTTCAKASELKLTAGKGSVSGDTGDATNEYGSAVACGGTAYMSGPQLYYKVALTAKQPYKLSLTSSFFGYLYAFPQNSCGSVSSINTACGTSGSGVKTGPVGPGVAGTTIFTPTTSGTFVVVVDSASSLHGGPFTLAVSTFTAAKNGKCADAQALSLTGGKASVSGDTTGIKNEHSSVKCGGTYALNGSQLYYKVALDAAKTYRLALTPAAFSGYVHVTPGDSCTKDGKKLDDACASKGKTGGVAGPVGPGQTGALYFTPAKGGSHIITVDSLGGGQSGAFSLEVDEFSLQAPATFTAPLSWDFDSACQNLGTSGDWQCGSFAFKADKSCDVLASTNAPKAPHSGSGMWGTVLNGCHTPAGTAKVPCANENPYDDSLLYFAVALPATWKSASLTYWSWDDYFLPYDWSEIRVDGVAQSQACTGTRASPVAWTKKTVDLSKFVGKTVTISFHFAASTTVNYSGWYVDDLEIAGK